MDNKEYNKLKETIEKEGFEVIGRKEFADETILYLKIKDKKEEAI